MIAVAWLKFANMSIDLKSLPVTRGEIEAALAKETRHWVRKRLIGVRAILRGETWAAAAHAARTSNKSLYRWLEWVRQDGLTALLHKDRPGRSHLIPIRTEGMAAARRSIARALASKPNARNRKRLLAIRAVLSGKTCAAVARDARVSHSAVLRWVHQFRQGGCASLVDGRAHPVHLEPMTARQVATIQREVEAALDRPLPERSRRRLAAIRLAPTGKISEAAEHAEASPVTISRWLRQIRNQSVMQFLRQYERGPSHFTADLAGLQALAAAEKDANIRKRILALAYVAAGVPINQTATTAALAPSTVRCTIQRFRREGMAAFRKKPILGPRVRLAPGQLRAVEAILRNNPGITSSDLCDRILAQFGIRYTSAGLKNLLKREFGIA